MVGKDSWGSGMPWGSECTGLWEGGKGQVKVQQVPVLDPEHALRQWRRRGLGVHLSLLMTSSPSVVKGAQMRTSVCAHVVHRCRPQQKWADAIIENVPTVHPIYHHPQTTTAPPHRLTKRTKTKTSGRPSGYVRWSL